MKIPFSQLANASKLTADYFDNFENVADFYSGDYRKPENFLDRAADIKARELPLAKLIPVLTEQNRLYGCGLPTLEKINWLIERRACAVVTGQQTGLFGGPLFTIYKALTAIKLAARLSRTCEGCYVPIFWLASDDHDFREVNHCKIIDKGNQLQTIQYDGQPADSGVPVSRILINEEIDKALETLSGTTHPSEFKESVLALLQDAYQPGTSFTDAFAKWLMTLFKPFGLIVIDASDPRIKALGRDLFQQEIMAASPSSKEALTVSDKLQLQGYHNQVPLKEDYLNLFYAEEDRVSLQMEHGSFLAKKLKRTFTHDELLGILDKHPEYFSPNVLLRPLYQDWLLPTIAYISGPSETAYYAQMKGIYQTFDLPMPIIYPRKSVTLLETKIEKVLDNFNLQFIDFVGDIEALINKVARSQLPENMETQFGEAAEAISATMQALESTIREVEPTLADFSKNTSGRILGQIEVLEKKVLQAFKKRNDVVRQQLYKAGHALYPNHALQERELNIVPYLFKHGFGFIDQLYEAIDVSSFEHQIVRV